MLDQIKPYLGTAVVVIIVLFIVKKVSFLNKLVS